MRFDPRRISYDELLRVFWNGQPIQIPPDPNPRVHLAVLPIGEVQRAAAERDKKRLSRRNGKIYVEILPEPTFWPAERMHQKFYFQRGRHDLIERLAQGFEPIDLGGTELSGIDAFLASTAAARLNAWSTPFGDEEDLRQAAELLGVEPGELQTVRDNARGSAAGSRPNQGHLTYDTTHSFSRESYQALISNERTFWPTMTAPWTTMKASSVD